MGDIWVLAEHRKGRLRDVSLEMLGRAAGLARQAGGRVVAILLGKGLDDLATTLAGHCDVVWRVESDGHLGSSASQRMLTDLLRERRPALLMIAQSAQGAELAPALAVAGGLSLTTDIVRLDCVNGALRATRQFYQGKVNGEYVLDDTAAHVVTVREGSFEAGAPGAPAPVEQLAVAAEADDGSKRLLDHVEAEISAVDITRSSVLIAVGRGIKEEKNLKMIEDLAAALKAEVCGSRAAVDAGWISAERQVGITGKTVKPRLYIAIGISGAFQHLAGIRGANTIVAINKDPNAPIFSVADVAIVDDLFKVVPKLTETINAMKPSR